MSKYIDLNEATDLFKGIDATMTGGWVADTLEALPTIDIVICEECRWQDDCSRFVKSMDGLVSTALTWCSDGERKEE